MTPSEQKLAEDDLDAFLEELGVEPTPESKESSETLDHLVEEIFDLTEAPSPAPASPSLPKLPTEETEKKRAHSTIWITAVLLIGLFAGCSFGYFWAKREGVMDKPLSAPQEEITTQISYWIRELTDLYDSIQPPEEEAGSPEEIIQPLPAPSEMEALAPAEMT